MTNGENGIETRVRVLEVRADANDRAVASLGTMNEAVIRLVGTVDTIQRDLANLTNTFQRELSDREEREEASRRDRNQMRIAMWTLTVMILVGLLGAATVILTSGHA